MKEKGGLIVVLLIQAAMTSRDPMAVCPSQPAEAAVGEAVTLQCHLEPQLDATNMTVEWTQGRSNHTVHLYGDGKDSRAEQRDPFRGRTSLFQAALGEGNLSLKLSSVRLSDTGSYRCSFYADQLHNSCYVDLTVVLESKDNTDKQTKDSSHRVIAIKVVIGIIIVIVIVITVLAIRGGWNCDCTECECVLSCLGALCQLLEEV